MKSYRIHTTVSDDGTLIIKKLPFKAGDKVEVLVRGPQSKRENGQRYPLRGKPIQYVDPFESVAEDDWDALR